MPLTDQKTTDPALYRHELGMLKLLVAKYPDEARRLMKRVEPKRVSVDSGGIPLHRPLDVA